MSGKLFTHLQLFQAYFFDQTNLSPYISSMLRYLNIHNLALLDFISLEFDPGFIAVTGETGAGKSILLGALSILSGSRTSKSIIKQNQDFAKIEASIYFKDPSKINASLEALSLPVCDESSLILSRTIFSNKPQKITINGALAPLTSLQALGESWIDFHGPSEPQKLFSNAYQLQMLDTYSNLSSSLKSYAVLFSEYKEILNKIKKIREEGQLSEEEIIFLQSQIDKIAALNPSPASIEELEAKFQRIQSIEEIAKLSNKIYSALSHPSSGAISILQHTFKSSQDLARFDPTSAHISERLNSAVLELEDIAYETQSLQHDIDLSPSAIEKIHQNMNLWLEIKRQFGPTIENVIKKKHALQEKIDTQSNIEEAVNALQKEASKLETQLLGLAQDMHKKRCLAAEELSSKTEKLLLTLGFQKAFFAAEVQQTKELDSTGNSQAQFLFSANVGQSPQPLNEIASSGETARVMLALKAVLAELDQTPILVFDEVDANVGGEVATKVAQEMANLAQDHQVFCVTHLPQVASKAHHHFLVAKTQSDSETAVSITKLSNPADRTNEIARMLGDRQSHSALNHAKDLLSV